MLSKKNALSLLSLIGAASSLAVMATGCDGTISVNTPGTVYYPPTQSLELQANLYDDLNQPLAVDFDYYLDLTLFDGTKLSYYKTQQTSDPYSVHSQDPYQVPGIWSYTAANLNFWVGDSNCYNSCVSYDVYGCTAYATDCYDNSYNVAVQMSDIIETSASIGVDTGINYYVIPSSQNLNPFYTLSNNVYTQNDDFYTGLAADYWNGGVLPQSVTPGQKPVAAQPKLSVSTKVAFKGVSAPKAKIITDLSTLTEAQRAQLNKNREHLMLTHKTTGAVIKASSLSPSLTSAK